MSLLDKESLKKAGCTWLTVTMHVQDSENFSSVFEGHLISTIIPHKEEEGSYAYLYRCKIPHTHFKGVGIRTLHLRAAYV
jgi:hypothetical protein